jgi:K+/H+ antiporter YhaU regulatory subunit KhtT
VHVPAVWVGMTLRELGLRQQTGVTVIGIQEAQDPLTSLTADPARPLAAGDVLVVLASSQASAALADLVTRASSGEDPSP